MKSIRLYLSSMGATNAVNVVAALAKSEFNAYVVGGDIDPLAVGFSLIDKGYVIPRVDDRQWLPTVLQICKENRVQVALPIYSADFPVFDKHRAEFEAEGIRTYAPSKAAWAITYDKYETIKFLSSINVPCPRTWAHTDFLKAAKDSVFPLFLKLRRGTGTRRVHIVKDERELAFHLDSQVVIQEYVEGEEYTVDVLSDLNGKMIAASPRKRLKVYGGLSVRGITVKDDEIVEYTRQIVEALKLPGPSNVQCKRCLDGSLKFYDINPRFASGGLPLAVEAGLNGPELLIHMLMAWKIPKIKIREGVIMNRYWTASFVSLNPDREEVCIER